MATPWGYATLSGRWVSLPTIEKIKKSNKMPFTDVQLRDIMILTGNRCAPRFGTGRGLLDVGRKRWWRINDPLRGVKNNVKTV